MIFWCQVIALHKKHNYLPDQTGNGEQTSTVSDMPNNAIIMKKHAKLVSLKTTEKRKAMHKP